MSAQYNVDSLLNLYSNSKDANKKIELLEEISNELTYYSIDSALYYTSLAIDLALTNKIDEQIIRQMIRLGRFQTLISDFESARKTLNTCLIYANAAGDEKSKGTILHSIAYGYFYEFQYIEALNYYFEALTIREKIQDSSGIAATNNNIGLIYWNLRQYNQALIYFEDALEMYEAIGNLGGVGTCYSNCGMIYSELGNIDSALYFFRNSLKISLELQDYSYIATDYANIGVAFVKKQMFDSAKIFLVRAYNIEKEFDNAYNFAIVTLNLADVYVSENKLDSALSFLYSSENKAKEIHAVDVLEGVYNQIARIYYKRGLFKEAFNFLDLHVKYKDTVFDEDVAEQITELEHQFSVEKKNEEIQFQELLLEQQETKLETQKKSLFYLKLFIISLLIFGFVTIWFFVKNKKSYKLLENRNDEIMSQKEKIEEQNIIITNQNVAIKSSITYASDIIVAMLPNENEIDLYFENYIFFSPKEIVSGDFYQMYVKNEDIFFILADCAGHGVPGALLSMLNIRILNRLINVYELSDPSEIIKELDNELSKSLMKEGEENKDVIDLGIIKFSKKLNDGNELKVQYSGASRDLVYYNPDTKMLERQTAVKSFVGGPAILKQTYITHEFLLPLDTVFYLYTDGVVDQTNKENIKLGRKRLVNKIEDIAILPIVEQGKKMDNLFLEWNTDYAQIDDITFIALKFKPQ